MKSKTVILMIIPVLSILFLIMTSANMAYSQNATQTTSSLGFYKIPSWIKNNAKWWADGSIGDNDFLKGIEYLINQAIMVIPQSQTTSSTAQQGIPGWIKNNAKWWADGSIGDDDFVKGMQFLVANNIIHVAINTTSPPPSQTPYHLSLLFVQYPSAADAPDVLSLMHQYLTLPTDYIQVEKNNLYQEFTNQRNLMVAASLKGINFQMNNPKTNGVPVYAVAYDFEHWSATPDSEQADPLGSMNTAADTVHAAGYKFGFAPDSKYLHDSYKTFDWKKVDVAWLQVGYNGRTYSTYVPFITDVINTIRTENPNAVIIVQLSLVVTSDPSFDDPVSQFNAEVDTVAKLKVDAISVVYLDPSKSPNFTISNLEKILAHIATLRK